METFTLSADASTSPLGTPSGVSVMDTPFLEQLALSYKKSDTVQLDADGAQAVVLPGGATKQAHVLLAKAVGGKVIATITTADGAAQVVSFDSLLIIINLTAPITALSFTRTPGTATTVNTFLGQQ